MSPRKRKRSLALLETEEDRGTADQHLDKLPNNDLDKERVVWDSFREERFEGM
jgi:hypothetical protein